MFETSEVNASDLTPPLTRTSSRVTTYTSRDTSTHFRAKVSRQVQPGTENPPNHNTNYTQRDTTTRSKPKPSHQVQSVPENPGYRTKGDADIFVL